MARHHHPASETGGYSGRGEAEHETIKADFKEDRLLASSCELRGELIGLGPDELIALAKRRLEERDEMIDRLLKHLPRKYEQRVKDLSAPAHDADRALTAVTILLGNARFALNNLSAPDKEEP